MFLMPTTPYFTLAQFRALTRLKVSRLGVAPGQTGADELLQTELDRAATYVEVVTGQPATDADAPTSASSVGSVSAGVMHTLIGQAIQMRTEQVLFQAQNGYVDDASDDVISNMSVGGFSQSKSDAARRGEQRTLNTWKALADLLWLIMTEERYEYWVVVMGGAAGAGAMMPPAFSYENTFWQPWGSYDSGAGLFGAGRVPIEAYGGGMGTSLPLDILPLDGIETVG